MKLFFALLSLLLFGGCYATKQEILFPEDRGSPLLQKWWRVFGDKELDALLSDAVNKNLSLKAEAERVLRLRKIYELRGSEKAPKLDARLFASYDKSEKLASQKSAGGSLRLSYEADIFKKLESLEKAGYKDLENAYFGLRSLQVVTTAQVAEAYFNIAFEKERLKKLKELRELAKKRFEAIEKRLEVGEETVDSLAIAANELASCDYRISSSEKEIEINELVLKEALSLHYRDDFKIEAKLPPAIPSLPYLNIESLAYRPDLMAQKMEVESLLYRYDAAIANQYPNLSIEALLSFDAESIESIFTGWYFQLLAAVTATIYDNGARRIEAESAYYAVKEALLRYKNKILAATYEVLKIIKEIDRQKGELSYYEKRVQNDKIALEVAYERLLSSEGTLQNFIDAKKREIEDRVSMLEAKRGVMVSIVAYFKATTHGWEVE